MSEQAEKSKSEAPSDFDLVRSFKGGEKSAFDELVYRYKNTVFNLCYWMLGDYEEANDSAQDCFVKIFQSLGKFKFKSSFYTWIYRIVVNTCKNKIKSVGFRGKRKMVPLGNYNDAKNSADSVEIADDSPSPANGLELKERRNIIRAAIASLPEKHKTVVVLRDIEGLSYEEISAITGSNLGTVKSRLARARIDLKGKLRGIL